MPLGFDNKRVLTISNYAGKEPQDVCQRYDRAGKKDIEVDRRYSIAIYHKFMGGVEKADMLLSLYRTRFRSRKWYHQLAFHFFSMAAVNAWLLYQQMDGNEALVKFLGKICFSLIQGRAHPSEVAKEMPKPTV